MENWNQHLNSYTMGSQQLCMDYWKSLINSDFETCRELLPSLRNVNFVYFGMSDPILTMIAINRTNTVKFLVSEANAISDKYSDQAYAAMKLALELAGMDIFWYLFNAGFPISKNDDLSMSERITDDITDSNFNIYMRLLDFLLKHDVIKPHKWTDPENRRKIREAFIAGDINEFWKLFSIGVPLEVENTDYSYKLSSEIISPVECLADIKHFNKYKDLIYFLLCRQRKRMVNRPSSKL
jgi:hypothetical protein